MRKLNELSHFYLKKIKKYYIIYISNEGRKNMAVAKSYENMQIISDPFDYDGKKYVKVKSACPRCGGSGHYSYNSKDGTMCYGCHGSGILITSVRWYSDKERASMDKAAKKRRVIREKIKEQRRIELSPYNKYGFKENGYIYILKGNFDIINQWAHETTPCKAKYSPIFGWYITPAMLTNDMPSTISCVKVAWDDIKDTEDVEGLAMKDDLEVKKYIQTLRYEPSCSEYQGTINDYIDRKIIIKKRVELNSFYGSSFMYLMEDIDKNVYKWITPKEFEIGKMFNMHMKVKAHNEYDGVKQTVVYYCKIKEQLDALD